MLYILYLRTFYVVYDNTVTEYNGKRNSTLGFLYGRRFSSEIRHLKSE